MWLTSLLSAAAFASLLPSVLAGPGVRLTACVDYAKKPDKPFNLQFTPSAGTCMRETGSRSEVLVKDKGLACAHLGYVEASDLLFYGKCKGNNRFLSLSFNEGGETRGEYVFQFEAHTLRPDKVEVENEVTGFDVGICEEPKLCTKKHRHFRDMEDWWIIIQHKYIEDEPSGQVTNTG